ncbi:MAG TPA: tRNA (adenosine(37)-N6)-dimethylallyltransferase MiaA [Candidatus Paceibacterota bacterium]
MPNKVIAVVGPTASGKSALAIWLARRFNGEVISVDSRQVYRELDIGSGKLAVGKRGGIKHHLLDVVNPKRIFTVFQYQKLAEKTIRDVINRCRLPILCGGTGFYLNAVLGDVALPPVPPNKILRAKLEKLSTKKLLAKLKILDPTRAEKIDSKNRRRLIRALEVATILTPQDSPWDSKKDYPWPCLKIGILVEKNKLRQRINRRLKTELESGLLAEVKKLRRQGLSWRRLDDLGLEYRFVSRYLRQQLTAAEMIKQLQTALWHYAKRQLTWFKRDPKIIWVKTSAEAEQRARDFLKKPDQVE